MQLTHKEKKPKCQRLFWNITGVICCSVTTFFVYNKNHLITEFSKEKFSDYQPTQYNYSPISASVYGTDALKIMAPDATVKG